MGYGSSSVEHSAKFRETNDKLPIVVAIIDKTGKRNAFLEVIRPILEIMRYGCHVTLEDTKLLMFKTGRKTNAFGI